MKFILALLSLSLLLSATTVMAYGSSSANKACDKPVFAKVLPADSNEIKLKSAFSFIASPITNPNSIKVSIKNQAIAVSLKTIKQGFLVTGILPDRYETGSIVRINVQAETNKACKGNDGWLVKIIP